MATIAISASVGRGGKNLSSDVITIKKVMAWLLPGKVLAQDGTFTPDLEAAIRIFQGSFLKGPDGRIDANNRSIWRINILASNGLSKYHRVPLLSQVSVKKCWEASARMMFAWRRGSLSAYAGLAGEAATQDRGRNEEEMNTFNTALGMKSKRRPKGEDILRLLGSGPVLITGVEKTWGHASVATGYDHTGGTYRINNPAGTTSFDFDDSSKDSATGKTIDLSMKTTEKDLGLYVWYW